jgi:hypothetical protein
MPIRVLVTGIPEARHQPITESQALALKLVSAWLKRTVLGACLAGHEISYSFAETSSPVREFRLAYASRSTRIAQWRRSMPPDDNCNCTGSALNGLTVQQQQTTFFLGHSLRSHYEDVIKARIPDHLLALAEQLERRAFFDAQNEIKSE